VTVLLLFKQKLGLQWFIIFCRYKQCDEILYNFQEGSICETTRRWP